jgi:hypothetical protein
MDLRRDNQLLLKNHKYIHVVQFLLGNYPKETVLHLQHGENSNLKSRIHTRTLQESRKTLVLSNLMFTIFVKLYYVYNI